VNSAAQTVTDETGNIARTTAVGGGKLNAGAAVAATVTSDPATISFGFLNNKSLPVSQQLVIANNGTAPASLSVSVAPRDQDANAHVSVDTTSFTLNHGQSQTVTVSLQGNPPVPGTYEGAVMIQGGGASLRIPYLYVVGDGVPFDLIQILPGGGSPGGEAYIAFKVVDQYGMAVEGYPIQWGVTQGGGSVETNTPTTYNTDPVTEPNGLAVATVVLGPDTSLNEFSATVGSLQLLFDSTPQLPPTIAAGGVLNGASFQAGSGIAPGSYVTIFGSLLSGGNQSATTSILPISLDSVNVSFDAGTGSSAVSVPASLVFVSPGQVNVQVPWELEGQSSAEMKVVTDGDAGNVVTLPVVAYSPAIFQYTEPSSSLSLAAALDQSYNLIGSANPAVRGATIQVYANGLGPVTNQPASGWPAPSGPLAQTTTPPTVTIGGQSAAVVFSGLAPGFPGLYQLNVTVPQGISTGVQPVVVTIGGAGAPAVSIPVK